jgi:hypothetical protein
MRIEEREDAQSESKKSLKLKIKLVKSRFDVATSSKSPSLESLPSESKN